MSQYDEALSVLGPAQRALAEQMLAMKGQGTPAEIISYASALNDYQALGTLAVQQGTYQNLRDPDGFQEMQNLTEHFGIEVTNYGQMPVDLVTEKQAQNIIESATTPATTVAVNPLSPALVVDTPAPVPSVVVQTPVTSVRRDKLSQEPQPGLPFVPASIQTWTGAQKVQFYRDLISEGWTDAEIRAAVSQVVGVQSDADWGVLVRLATAPATAPATVTTPGPVTAVTPGAPTGGNAGLLIAAAAAYFLLG